VREWGGGLPKVMGREYVPWPEEPPDGEDHGRTEASGAAGGAVDTGDGSWRGFFESQPGKACVLYCLIYVCLGLCLSTFGPVILDLSVQTSATLQATGQALIIRSVGYLVGSLFGFLYDSLPGHWLLCFAMCLACAGTLAITFARSSFALAGAVSLQGVALGLIDTGANLMLLWAFREKSGPPMQALHCAFGVGATLGPLLETAVELQVSPGASGERLVGQGSYNLAFYIIAGLCAALALALHTVASPRPRKNAAPDPQQASAPPAPAGQWSLEGEKWRIVFVTAVLLGVYVGVETGFGSYVTAFSVLYNGSTEAQGQLLAGTYWGAITAGRFASIWIASLISNSLFLRASMAASAASAVFLLALGGTEGGLWVGSIAYGLAMACVYPTTLSLVESFFPLVGRHLTVIMIGSATGEMILPFIVAMLFGGTNPEERSQSQSPLVLMWVLSVFSLLNVGVLYILLHLGKKLQERNTSAMTPDA
jgi:FHS family Na+ dependent glucose MFS transporter 1